MISLYEPKFSYCDLDLEDRNPFFTHDTLAYNGVLPYWVWLQMVQRCIRYLTLTETLSLAVTLTLNTAIQYFHWTLLCLWWSTIKSVWLQKTHWFRTNKRYSRNRRILINKALSVTLTLRIESHYFAEHSGSWWCTTIPRLVTKGCIHSAEWEQICVTSLTSLNPEDTTVLSLL